jgi:hypothetical protein
MSGIARFVANQEQGPLAARAQLRPRINKRADGNQNDHCRDDPVLRFEVVHRH